MCSSDLLNVIEGARTYDPGKAGVPNDLALRLGPPVPAGLIDPLVKKPVHLSPREVDDLVAFVREGLFDARVSATNLCGLVPPRVPSGKPVLTFEACP